MGVAVFKYMLPVDTKVIPSGLFRHTMCPKKVDKSQDLLFALGKKDVGTMKHMVESMDTKLGATIKTDWGSLLRQWFALIAWFVQLQRFPGKVHSLHLFFLLLPPAMLFEEKNTMSPIWV